MKNLTINIQKILSDLIHRYNVVLFVVMIAGGLIGAIVILSDIQAIPFVNSSTTGNGGESSTIFDQSTLTRLSGYETSNNNNSHQMQTSGRINPFSE